ncbi:hypothetical protein LCGC14_2853090 [marine sediment metagenome]|uniref:Uncharacterized protein n=1 Tax=marine sediment metagenome TaxID=412755 RepID=A0A0F9AYS8_9ZZZZ
MTWTQADIDTLKAAIASGVLSVSYGGPPSRSTTYQNLSEMRKLLAEMIRDVNGTTSFRRARHRKGF